MENNDTGMDRFEHLVTIPKKIELQTVKTLLEKQGGFVSKSGPVDYEQVALSAIPWLRRNVPMSDMTLYQGKLYITVDGMMTAVREGGLKGQITLRAATSPERDEYGAQDTDFVRIAEYREERLRETTYTDGRIVKETVPVVLNAGTGRANKTHPIAHNSPIEKAHPARMAEWRAVRVLCRRLMPAWGQSSTAEPGLEVVNTIPAVLESESTPIEVSSVDVTPEDVTVVSMPPSPVRDMLPPDDDIPPDAGDHEANEPTAQDQKSYDEGIKTDVPPPARTQPKHPDDLPW